MKKITLIFAILAITAFYSVADTPTSRIDTIAVVERPHKVVITEKNDGGIIVDVKGSDNLDKFSYTYSNEYRNSNTDSIADKIESRLPFLFSRKDDNSTKVKVRWFEHMGLYIGFNSMTGLPDGTGKMSESVEFGLLCPISMAVSFPHRFRIITGLGFGWKNYKLSTPNAFVLDDAGNVVIGGYDDGAYYRLSRLKQFNLDIPVLLKKSFGKFSVVAGTVVNFNLHGSILSRYRIDNVEQKVVNSGINHRKVTADLWGAVAFSDMGIYVKYTPVSVLKGGQSPDFKAFTVGFVFGI